MDDRTNTLRPAWYQPDLFNDEWLRLSIIVHMHSGVVTPQVGYEVVDCWTDEVIATGAVSTGTVTDPDQVALRAAQLCEMFTEAFQPPR